MSGPIDSEDETPPPREVALEAWREATRVRRRLEKHERDDDKVHVHILGLDGQAGTGRLSTLEAEVREQGTTIADHGKVIESLKGITWKIITAAGLAGAFVAAAIEIVRFMQK